MARVQYKREAAGRLREAPREARLREPAAEPVGSAPAGRTTQVWCRGLDLLYSRWHSRPQEHSPSTPDMKRSTSRRALP